MKKRYTYNRLSGTDIVVNESMRGVVEKLNWTCASTQEANPTPDAPKPIYSSGDGGKIQVWSHKKDYEPYTGSTTDIILPTGYVGGSLPNGVADSDTQKKIGKVVLNGSEAWAPNVQATYVEFAKTGLIPQATGSYVNCLSTHFSSVYNTTNRFLTNGGVILIRVPIEYGITTSAQFNTWLASQVTAGTPVTAYYPLATPVGITITKPQIPTYEGANTITTTNNIKPSLTIEAWKK